MIRIRRPVLAVALALLSHAAAAEASLSPLDDFEVGGFALSGPTDTLVPIPGYWSHAIWTDRNIYLTGGNALLQPGLELNDHMSLTLPTGQFCRVEYVWGFSKDLTFAGTVEQIEMQVRGPAGAQVTAVVTNGVSTIGATETIPFAGTVTLVWPVVQWLPALMTQATGIWFAFGAGDYEIDDIRFRTYGSSPVDFTGDFVASQIPPVPSSPLRYRAFDEFGDALYAVDMAIGYAETDAQTVPAADWTWSETAALGGEAAEMSFLWTDFGGVMETNFDFTVDVSAANGYIPDLYPPDEVHGPESILLNFPIAMRDAGGVVQGVSNIWLSFDFLAIQLGSLEFYDVVVTENAATRSWTDGFTLSFRMAFSGFNSPDEVFPLFTATWLSDWTTQVPTGVVTSPAMAVAGEPLRIVAAPSITRTGTEIRASRPFERAATVLIHDVSGRRIRSLFAAPGSQSVRWDGRDPSGDRVAAGIYFAHLADRRGDGIVRIVTIR